jgi:serine/threonine protein kinase
MCVATALLIAVFFQLLHATFQPYRSPACTRLQHLCLSIITILYFAGLLLKVQVVTEDDEQYLGWMLVTLLSSVFMLTMCMVLNAAYAVLQAYWLARRAQQVLDDNKLVFDPTLQEHIIAYEDLELLEVLGEGAEGVVRKGKYDGDTVALKIVTINTVVDRGGTDDREEIKQAMDDAQAEAMLMRRLRHPNIVLFYGISLHINSLGLSVLVVMELCGHSLSDQIGDASIAMGWLRKVRYALDIATGMHYLQQKGVVHRDLKPSNVLVDEHGKAKVADFGGSVLLLKKDQDAEEAAEEAMEMTANVGTPVYMAPELMVSGRKANYDGLVDVYSFGITLWAILARARPYANEDWNMWTMRGHIVNGARPDLDAAELALAPSSLIRLLMQCWTHDPADRPQGFGEIVQRLKVLHLGLEKESYAGNGLSHRESGDDAVSSVREGVDVVEHESVVVNPMLKQQASGSVNTMKPLKSWKIAALRGRAPSEFVDEIASRDRMRASVLGKGGSALKISPSKKKKKMKKKSLFVRETSDHLDLQGVYPGGSPRTMTLEEGFFNPAHNKGAGTTAIEGGSTPDEHVDLYEVYGEAEDYDEAEAVDAFGEMTSNPMTSNPMMDRVPSNEAMPKRNPHARTMSTSTGVHAAV